MQGVSLKQIVEPYCMDKLYCTRKRGHKGGHHYYGKSIGNKDKRIETLECNKKDSDKLIDQLEHSLSLKDREVSRLNKHIVKLDATIEAQQANVDRLNSSRIGSITLMQDSLSAVTDRAERAEAYVTKLLDCLAAHRRYERHG